MLGTEIIEKLRPFGATAKRDSAVLDAIDLRVEWPLVDVVLSRKDCAVTIRVTSDVFALGTNDDHVRVPVAADTAQRIADALELSLITPSISDAIWKTAKHRLRPQYMNPNAGGGRAMMGVDYFAKHNELIKADLDVAGASFGDLVAGHKKDIVITNHALDRPGYLVIYGWHKENGQPTQPEEAAHEIAYRDYSHGLRLMSPIVAVDNACVPLAEVVKDPKYAALFSPRPPLRFLRYPTE